MEKENIKRVIALFALIIGNVVFVRFLDFFFLPTEGLKMPLLLTGESFIFNGLIILIIDSLIKTKKEVLPSLAVMWATILPTGGIIFFCGLFMP